MKKLVPFVLTCSLALAACSPAAEKLNNNGNEAFLNQDYDAAIAAYQQAQTDLPEAAEPHYNAANTLYRQENFEQARQEIEQALVKNTDAEDKSFSINNLFNLGNTFFKTEDYASAIESYKETLRLNPTDLEAKQNLELAMLQQQQQEQEQQQQEQEQQENQEQQDQQQEGQQGDQQQDDGQQGDQQDEQQEGQQGDQQDEQQEGQQGDQQQDDSQQGDQQDEQQEGQQGDQQNDQQQDGQQGNQPQNGQAGNQQSQGQPQQVKGLTPQQAKQLFEAAAQGTESLEEHLQQILVAPPGSLTGEDW